MKRDLITNLEKWKNSPTRKPLILQGARQVGKTFLLKEFGKTNFDSCIYLNFDADETLDTIFNGTHKISDIIDLIGIREEKKIIPGKTLLIFDEVQFQEYALNSLKYFQENAPEYHIVAAGSLLGISLSGKKSFPVGKVNFMTLHPMNFLEFLTALSKTSLREFLDNKKDYSDIPDVLHRELTSLLKIYTFIGGMPEAVSVYLQTHDLIEVRKIQNEILSSQRKDFARHASKADAIKINQILDSIPLQLAKENKKFVFSAVKGSARSRDYETAMQWLLDAGLIHKVTCVSRPLLPLDAYLTAAFKIYFFDTGLLAAMVNLSQQTLIGESDIFIHFKGSMTENLAVQALIPTHERLYYWRSEGQAEIDFILSVEDKIVPIEIKSGTSVKSKSLGIYADKFSPATLLRASLKNFSHHGITIEIPLYALIKVHSFLN
ncbi:MAG: hypothetical protein A2268_00625 [Candidatus Raymondbacteria bacterium RifOxyA12_full_50_37]|uniref:ATPase n=1 Tax=Candidatus Raymondbacteria bacterium RIFOXYD12_FULL_49_13 TaxID=1817890 RepID=A0A1F7F1H8_UNCRA|nr:MAG: hypothetical protein A2350_20400 [Candidatus Raymondbacteria bacterium RifOxyB12_full_50_8]OGJ90661.1 MAG: hypothetical protein A2268_00625 [Candidatus Raymondbacteria bacterium RifOxyA12_full_50_37]OGJ92004.1 MAG: hypothetical protein A2248_15685 [Candidatus Raymondbacteria bacterium RIFOXYA2_FULL_49_16]OGK00397.1 MAG: hypothetical protein A2519_01180 [Candidatus Raymondbacteria bacterium RIFOXYD12_FULL_49_13]OGK04809.1 MAG: hypothetical protein A2487_11560 [Candidatus Raymondbacteria 